MRIKLLFPYNKLKKILTALLIFYILSTTGCECSKFYMKDIKIVTKRDKYMKCAELNYAINKANTLLNHAEDRCAAPHIFARNPACILHVKQDALINQYKLNKRIDYLNNLFVNNGCKTFELPKEVDQDQAGDTLTKEKVEYIGLGTDQAENIGSAENSDISSIDHVNIPSNN